MIANDIMRTDFLAVDADTSVAKLITHLIERKQRAAVVFEDEKYMGITHSRLFVRNKFDAASWKVKRMCHKPAVLSGTEDVLDVMRLMYVSDSPILPVIKDGVVGVVFVEDLLAVLKQGFKGKPLSEVMTKEPIVVKEKDRIGKVVEIMFDKKIEHVPVVDNASKLIGLVSVTDFMTKLFLHHYHREHGESHFNKGKGWDTGKFDAGSLEIDNFMSSEVIYARSDDSVSDVICQMQKFNVLSIPVVNPALVPVGILTIRDLLKSFYVLQRGNDRSGI